MTDLDDIVLAQAIRQLLLIDHWLGGTVSMSFTPWHDGPKRKINVSYDLVGDSLERHSISAQTQ